MHCPEPWFCIISFFFFYLTYYLCKDGWKESCDWSDCRVWLVIVTVGQSFTCMLNCWSQPHRGDVMNEWIHELWFFGCGSNIEMLYMEQCRQQWFVRQELLLSLPLILTSNMRVRFWSKCTNGFNLCRVRSGEMYQALLSGTVVSEFVQLQKKKSTVFSTEDEVRTVP